MHPQLPLIKAGWHCLAACDFPSVICVGSFKHRSLRDQPIQRYTTCHACKAVSVSTQKRTSVWQEDQVRGIASMRDYCSHHMLYLRFHRMPSSLLILSICYRSLCLKSGRVQITNSNQLSEFPWITVFHCHRLWPSTAKFCCYSNWLIVFS